MTRILASRPTMNWRLLFVTLWFLAAPPCAAAQVRVDSLLPSSAANCGVTTPPETAGIAVTPGGFVIVHPRNDALPDGYTGCKVLWIADVDQARRMATLYFERGELRRAIAINVRDPAGALEGACAFPEERSLLPTAGRRLGDAACKGFRSEALYALRVPTWPRRCMSAPDAPVCKAEPR